MEGAKAEVKVKDGMIQRLEISVSELVQHPITRQQGYAAPAGPIPDEVLTYLNLRKAERTKKKRSEGVRKANQKREMAK